MNDSDAIFRIVVTGLGMVGYSYLFVRQLFKVRASRDVITPLRLMILAIFLLTIMTYVPSIIYQASVLMGDPSQLWRRIAVYTVSVNQVATLILIIAFANYRIKDE